MMSDHPLVPDQNAWNPWSPAELSQRLDGVSLPWCVVGGWALDLWQGSKTREHDDLEFTVLREDLSIFRRKLGDMEFYTVNDGTIEPLPADQHPAPEIFQIWCFDRPAGCWRADMMIEPGTNDTWVYKRNPEIRRPRIEMVSLTADGIPYLNPSAVLLFKAKHRRPKDEDDFARAQPKLPLSESLWLRDYLERLHPGHDWVRALRLP
ncbi:nucleotidyltransferase domain-containing protein [Agrobacterium sp. LMR679]|uniref:nucleotidyltransferase domain-containing protein n=1 Tax=Agrobacterium sp. LMR679 TaxID=3014335 RepID=UPI0022AF6290|nr:amino acid transporter [Agrobacterium sp. LMR679]MCZ4071950.1 amino acid transporter [Agrobacterium sp. LMR679]